MSFVAEVEVEVEVMLAVNIFPWITFIGLSTTYFGSESTRWLIWTRTDQQGFRIFACSENCSVSVGAEFRSALEADTIGLHPLCHSALIADQKISKHLKLCSALDIQMFRCSGPISNHLKLCSALDATS